MAEKEQQTLNEQHLPEIRRQRIARLVREMGSVAIPMLEARFGISAMTVRRDLMALEQEGKVRRTRGGAVPAGFAGYEDSFQKRLEEAQAEKSRLARAAIALLKPGETVFVDSSTTSYYFVRQIISEGLQVTILTNSLPVTELFTKNETPNVGVVGIGGTLRKLTASYVGPHALHLVRSYFADKTFLSARGLTNTGHLTDPDTLEAEVKRAMIEQSRESILLIDKRKFEHRALSVITHVSNMRQVLAADAPEDRLKTIAEGGVGIMRA